MTFEFKQRISAVKNDDYHLELDEYRRGDDQLLLVHFRVRRWAPSVLKRMQREWRLFRAVSVSQPLFATGEVDDEKWRRFVSLFGFKPLMDVVTLSGEPRRMYVHGLNNFKHHPIGLDDLRPLDPSATLPP